jgi:hypothetical protein
MDKIKYSSSPNNSYFFNGKDMYDIKTKKVVDVEPRRIRLGDMVHYYKTPEYNERLEKVYNPEDKDDIKSRKLFVVFNLIMKDKWLEFISWDKLEDIIFFDSRNEYLVDLEKQSKEEVNHQVNHEERFKNMFQSEILTSGNEIYVICKIDPETEDHYYAFERAPNIMEAQRNAMGLSPKDFKRAYWGMKQEYLTKKIGNNIICDFTRM